MKKNFFYFITMALLMSAVLPSCKGDDGLAGTSGIDGKDGKDGKDAVNPAFIEIMNSSVNLGIFPNTTGKVVFRVNPSNATVPTGSGNSIADWKLDQTGTGAKSSYVTTPDGFELLSIEKDGDKEGQYIAKIKNTGAKGTYFMALALNASGKLVSSSSFSLRGMMFTAKIFQQRTVAQFQNFIDTVHRLGTVNQIQLLARQLRVDGVPEILTKSGYDLWLIAPIMYHDDNHPEGSSVTFGELGRDPKWAVCNDGNYAFETLNPVNIAAGITGGSWLHMVCPNDKEYLDYRIDVLKKDLSLCHFTGISLDFMRYYAYWEGTYINHDPKALRNSCFCDDCLAEYFSKYPVTGAALTEYQGLTTTVDKANFILSNPSRANNWTLYKCSKLDENIAMILFELRKDFPHLQANLHGVPWGYNSFEGALRRIVGQDFQLLAPRLDQISVMTYHRMNQRPPQWINDITADIYSQVNGKTAVLPTLQGNGGTDAEFEAGLISAIKAPASGVVIWQLDDRLTKDRLDIIDKILNPSK